MTATDHGRVSTYVRHRCRCDECREANRVAKKAFRAQRTAELAAGRVVVPHGNVNTYLNYGCRCEDCREAKSRQSARDRRKVVS